MPTILLQSRSCYPDVRRFKKQNWSTGLLVLFTGTTSHKMVQSALDGIKGGNTVVERCHSSSMNALKGILDEHSQLEKYMMKD